MPKRVLITTGVYPPESGGPATYSKLLVEELPKRGIEAVVLPFREVRSLPKILRHFAYFLKALKRARGAEIIFAQDPVSVGLPSALAAKILGKKFLLKVVGDYAWEQYCQQRKSLLEFLIFNFKFSKPKKKEFIFLDDFQSRNFDFLTELRRKIERWVARQADKIIVPSKYLKKIVMMWGVEERKIEVVYNAFEPPKAETSKEEARKKLGLKGFILISAGRLVPWKGFGALVEIMPEIAREISEAKLYIIGDGPDYGNLKSKIKKLNLEGVVFALGSLPRGELLQYLCAGDVFVLNTGYEGFSHLLLEAMAMGIPVITTKAGGNPEIIEDNKNGLLVEYNDKAALKEAVLKLYRQPEFGERLAKNAREKLEEFSKERMLERTMRVLEICNN